MGFKRSEQSYEYRYDEDRTHKRLETAIISALTADVTAMLKREHSSARGSGSPCASIWWRSYKTTSRIAIAPPLPITTAAAAGAASPALVWEGDRGLGYVGNFG